jgi:succinyl-diaminopimelate desuccinylase
VDPLHIKLLSDLVGLKTITPRGEEAINYCSEFLKSLGFSCKKLNFGDVSNLYAKYGNFDKNFCFAGHIDVVPPLDNWDTDPFVLTEQNGKLYGRGTNDMKGPLSSCLAALRDFVKSEPPNFSISVILTSDEEIMGTNGTKKVVEFLKDSNEKINGCVLCESCSSEKSGEYIKIGCRGSLNVDFVSNGYQCHVTQSKIQGNHLHSFMKFLNDFINLELDKGNDNFAPSDIELTSVDVGNDVRNIIPRLAAAKLNIRFNDLWNFETLENYIKEKTPSNIAVSFERFGAPFVGSSNKFNEFLSKVIEDSTGVKPGIGTIGGNSDALFIKDITDVVEIGSPTSGAHVINEFISKDDLMKLRTIYLNILRKFADSYD